jgi:predicted cupin superfamily sugar epimerase
MNAAELAEALALQPLAGEGGLWAQVHRDASSNSIYFMMIAPDFSAWHRIKEPELWVHLAGGALELFTIESGELQRRVLDGSSGAFTYRVPADTWLAARPISEWTLALCALTPAFSGMELAGRSELVAQYPGIPELFHS